MVSENVEGDVQFINGAFLGTAIFLNGLQHIVLDTDIVNHQSFVLAIKHAIDTRDGLDKGMLLQGLVNIHYGQRRNIKAGNPHIDNDSNFEVGVIVLELTVKHLAIFLSTTSLKQILFIVCALRSHKVDFRQRHQLIKLFFRQHGFIFCTVLLAPFRANSQDFLQQTEGNRTVSTDNHCLLHDFRLLRT